MPAIRVREASPAQIPGAGRRSPPREGIARGRAVASWVSSAALERGHCEQRARDDQQVEGNRLMLDVVQVIRELHRGPVDAAALAVVHLSPAGEAGSDREPRVVVGDALAELLDVADLLGTRPDNAHVAAEDVPRLRELVEMQATEHPPNAGDALVVHRGPVQLLSRPRMHGAQLEDLERPPEVADAILRVEERAAILELDG